MLAQAPASSLRNTESVAKTWSLSFAELKKNKPAALDLLKLLAYLHPDAISEDVLRDGSSALKSDLAVVLGDPWEINNVVREAIKLSLLHRDAKSRALRMHRLLQVVLRLANCQSTLNPYHRLNQQRARVIRMLFAAS